MDIARFKKARYMIPAATVFAPIVIALFVTVSGGVVMLLWNWLLPPLFDWPRITLLQGFGLLALCRILFGGFGKGGGGGHHGPSKKMTREERERFRQRMIDRSCGASDETRESRTGERDSSSLTDNRRTPDDAG